MTDTPPQLPASAESKAQGVVATGWLASSSMFGSHDEHRAQRAFGASLATIVLHGLLFLAIGIIFAYHEVTQRDAPPPEPMKFVYLQEAGPGGGGGGSPAPAPNKPLSIPKTKAPAPVPVTPPPPTPEPPKPAPTLTAPIMTTTSDLIQASGTSGVSLAAFGGGGRGTGLGSGTGSGVGPGTGGGFGGGAYHPGNGVTFPTLLRDEKPKYTAEAMRAKIQGKVLLEAVVDDKGTVADVHVLKSLDKLYGLDQEAMKAARLWAFRPGRDRDGKAVSTIVEIELTFNLH